MTSNFPQVKVKYQATDQEFPKTTNRINGGKKKKPYTQAYHFQITKKIEDENFLKEARGGGKHITYTATKVRVTSRFFSEALQKRRE